MDATEYSILVTENDQECTSRVIGALGSHRMEVSRVAQLPSIKRLARALDQKVVLVIITGGIHEPETVRFLDGVRHAPPNLGVFCLLEPTEPEKLSFFDRLGVDEVFEKPVDGSEIAQAARRLIQRKKLIGSTEIIGKAPQMREVIERVAQYSQVNSTVLISGASGTGKELVAQAIHRLSARRHHPFIAVNCGAIAEGVLESELFGHEKGSFTGATSLRKGHFEIASGGTIFLDEVGEMPLSVQVKLLRVLEERDLMRVGGSQKIKVDVRVLAATNKDLELEVESGNFRRDLYYRLKVLSIHIPTLRERREDIPLLLNYFIEKFCKENDKTFAGIDDEAVAILQNYDWPGNTRELRNLAESMVVLSLGTRIRARDIPDRIFRMGSPERLLPVPLARGDEKQDASQQAMEHHLLYQGLVKLQKDMDYLKQVLSRVPEMVRGQGYTSPDYERVPFPGYQPEEIREPEFHELTGDHPEADDQPAAVQKGRSMQEIEKQAILRTLETVGGNRRQAARVLGIGERTLYRKLKQYGIK